MSHQELYRIPRKPIAEAIEEYLDKQPPHVHQRDPWPVTMLLDILEKRTGAKRGTLRRQIAAIRSGAWPGGHKSKIRTIDFNLADSILCALEDPMRFYTDPRLYRVYSRMKPREETIGGRPLCVCHEEPMHKSGVRRGSQEWRCAIRANVIHRARYHAARVAA